MTRLDEVPSKSIDVIKEGSWYRCFRNVQIASLFSRIDSLPSRNGSELERLIPVYAQSLLIYDLDAHLEQQIMAPGVKLVEKKVIKESHLIEGHGIEPDLMIFQREKSSQYCFVVELKDGYNYDTKASAKEHQNLRTFLSRNAMALQSYQSSCKLVSFNAQTHEEIIEGFKRKFAPEQVMTGAEFCEILGIDYDEIRQRRSLDAQDNIELLIEELSQIPEIRDGILQRVSNREHG